MEQVNESSVIRKLEDRTQGILWDHGSKTDRTLHPTIIGINELQTFFFSHYAAQNSNSQQRV